MNRLTKRHLFAVFAIGLFVGAAAGLGAGFGLAPTYDEDELLAEVMLSGQGQLSVSCKQGVCAPLFTAAQLKQAQICHSPAVVISTGVLASLLGVATVMAFFWAAVRIGRPVLVPRDDTKPSEAEALHGPSDEPTG